MKNHSRKTYSKINLPALVNNYITIKNLAPESETIAVVKANAYGHGAIEVANYLSQHVSVLAVAFIDEAIELRKAGITLPILILEGPLSIEDYRLSLEQNFWLIIHNAEQIEWLTSLTNKNTGNLWLKIDTGMNRLGIKPNDVDKIIKNFNQEQLKNLVLCTHFSSAEQLDNPKTKRQIQQFDLVNKNYNLPKSLANSAGIINWPTSHGDFNRLGLSLYGATPIPRNNLSISLTPVMTLLSTVIALRKLQINESVGYGEKWQAKRPSVIATIAIGYADGYPRNAKNGTPVFIKGQIAPLAGRVSMDMITIDITDIDNVIIGDTVELWGNNLPVETVAEYCDTNNYELLTRVTNRVPRKYIT